MIPWLLNWRFGSMNVIYDPRSSENEAHSAELMWQLCSDVVDDQTLQKVYRWIIATQYHQHSAEHDLSYLLDIDLAILAAP